MTVQSDARKKTKSFHLNGKTLRTPKGGLRKTLAPSIKRYKRHPSLSGTIGRKSQLQSQQLSGQDAVLTSHVPVSQDSAPSGFAQPSVLMFGWELPPFNSGGLGVASFGLAQSLSGMGASITFVLPKKVPVAAHFMKLIFASEEELELDEVHTNFSAYRSSSVNFANGVTADWGDGLTEIVRRYGRAARRIAKSHRFDVIHAHDWLCIPAGIEAKRTSGKPFVVHIHATEFDRTGGTSINQKVYDIERDGFENADRIISVSGFTKQRLVDNYGIQPEKIDVVYNGVSPETGSRLSSKLAALKQTGKKIVLFVGRLTMQKGPDYFLSASQIVSRYDPNVLFFITGAGDMENQIIASAASMGISDRVIFAGFLRGEELSAVYEAADVFVMPSVSEPFGITALEALSHKTPLIVSKQSGVAEILYHALKVDFWDVEEMANKILSILQYRPLHHCLATYGNQEAAQYNWERAARECLKVYEKVT